MKALALALLVTAVGLLERSTTSICLTFAPSALTIFELNLDLNFTLVTVCIWTRNFVTDRAIIAVQLRLLKQQLFFNVVFFSMERSAWRIYASLAVNGLGSHERIQTRCSFYLYRRNGLTSRLLQLIKNTYLYQINSIFGWTYPEHCKSEEKFEVQVATAK